MMNHHEFDRLPEEREAPDLLADFKEIYKADPDDQQSLIRIRARLQSQFSQATTAEMPITFSTARFAERGKQTARNTQRAKGAFPRNRLNTAIALLIAASVIGAFILTFAWLRHPNIAPSTPSLTPTAQQVTQQSPQPDPWNYFRLTNPTTAWVPTLIPLPVEGDMQGPLLRTTDAGKTWHDVTPPQMRLVNPYILYPLKDGKTAWIADAATYLQQAHFYRTQDGGQTWQQSFLPRGIAVSMLVFVDKNHGWYLGEALGKNLPEILFATTDGGQTWQQRSDQALLQAQLQSDEIQFVDTQTGWLTTVTSSGQQNLFITHNAGSSWVPLPLSKEITAKGTLNFTFLTAKHGYLFVNHRQQKTGKEDVAYFYETNDGGKTWQNQIFEPAVPINVEFPSYMNEHQIQIQSGNTIAIYTQEKNHWRQNSSYTFPDRRLFFATFASATTGLGVVDYSKDPSGLATDADQMGLVKTTNGGKTWTKMPLSFPTRTITPATMTYLTYPGWSYDTAYEGTSSQTLKPVGKPSSGNLDPLMAKKWLVRFFCPDAAAAELTVDGKQVNTSGCKQHPVSTVISFDTTHSIQKVSVQAQPDDFWLIVLQACTNEKLCLANPQ